MNMSSPKINERILKLVANLTPARLFARTTEKASETVSATTKPARYGFVDLLRGFALVMMIETHVVNAYYPVAHRRGSSLFFWLSFVNGLVAPGFLFASGFSLVLQANSQWNSWIHFRKPFWRQMRRLGFICLVAYYSHLQGFRLSRYLRNWGDVRMWDRTLQIDVLQCIVISLLVLHLLICVLRKKALLPWGAGLLAIGVALTTPLVWSHNFRGQVPLSIALALNPHGVSLFPIFPWICFVLAGAVAGCIFLKSAESGKILQFMRGAACLALGMITAGLLLRGVPFTLPGYVNFYTTSPLYIMIRIGCILLICALLYIWETTGKWVPRPIQLAGQESLLVYGVHLWIIFALLRGKHLGPILGLQSGYLGCCLLSATIAAIMLPLARFWHALKKNYPAFTKFAQAVTVVIMIAIFALN
jgi:uncharacterized membrane protein